MSDTKMCPYCGKDIKVNAIKCMHCKSMLSKEDDQLVEVKQEERKPKGMSKTCQTCGKKLALLSWGTMCKECKTAYEAEIANREVEIANEFSNIQSEIVINKDINEQQIELLRKQNKRKLVSLYSKVYEEYVLTK